MSQLSGDYNAGIPALLLIALVTTSSPAHALLFAPPARADRCEFLTSSDTIDVVAAEYRRVHPSPDPGSWVIRQIGALDAFDGAALYDRARLARLYRGQTPRIARGPMIENGSVTSVVLLISPYPEPDLKRLNPGTLIMVVSAK